MKLLRYLVKWLVVCGVLGTAVGSACALFLWSLNWATEARFAWPWLLWLLPAAGICIAWMYHRFGKRAEGGNNLLIDEIHEPGGGVPLRLAPLVLIGTVLTHLCGGSAGREGTAVQMGGSLAGTFGRWMRLGPKDTRVILMAGIAAGFGAVFGTPLAGAIFAVEVLAIGRVSFDDGGPCLMAALVGDWICTAWGIHHTPYDIASMAANAGVHVSILDWNILEKVAIAGILFGLAGLLFAQLAHGIGKFCKRWIKWPMLRPVVGSAVVIGMVFLFGRDYLGLGVTSPIPGAVTIVSSFHDGGAGDWSWLLKIVFTAVTIGSGFKGGEVTPLFFIGAALGNVTGRMMGGPVDLFAGVGFAAVFAGAANTPLACTVMGMELFGWHAGIYLAVGCYMAYLFSGHRGIYHAQRVKRHKWRLSRV